MDNTSRDIERLSKDVGELKLQCKALEVKMDIVDPQALIKFQSKVVETLETVEGTLKDYSKLKTSVGEIRVKLGAYITIISVGISLILSNLGTIAKIISGG